MNMTLDEIFEHGVKAAQTLFAAQGEVQPMWIAQSRRGEIMPIVAPIGNKESKERILGAVRAMFKEHDIVRYVSILEAWCLEMKEQKELPKSILLGAPISQHPQRREIIAIAAEDKTEGMLTGMLYILRPEHGRATLSPCKRMPKDTRHEGRFVGLL